MSAPVVIDRVAELFELARRLGGPILVVDCATLRCHRYDPEGAMREVWGIDRNPRYLVRRRSLER